MKMLRRWTWHLDVLRTESSQKSSLSSISIKEWFPSLSSLLCRIPPGLAQCLAFSTYSICVNWINNLQTELLSVSVEDACEVGKSIPHLKVCLFGAAEKLRWGYTDFISHKTLLRRLWNQLISGSHSADSQPYSQRPSRKSTHCDNGPSTTICPGPEIPDSRRIQARDSLVEDLLARKSWGWRYSICWDGVLQNIWPSVTLDGGGTTLKSIESESGWLLF